MPLITMRSKWGLKYLYIRDSNNIPVYDNSGQLTTVGATHIHGHFDNNNSALTLNGITFDNKDYILTAIYGV
jgi:hypothetical protein